MDLGPVGGGRRWHFGRHDGAGVTVEFLDGISCDQCGETLDMATWIGIIAGWSGVVLTLVALRTPAPSTKRTLNLSAAVLFVVMVVLIIIGEI